MTRPIAPRPFNAVCAPSKSRPQLPYAKVHADAHTALLLMGASGVAGFTEISHPEAKAVIRNVFGPHRVGVALSDCPIVWTDNYKRIDGGVDFGARAIPVVAPARRTAWVILEDSAGTKVGVISTHMHPGGFAAHPSPAQRLRAPLIRALWQRHRRRIQTRVGYLAARCDVVVMLGDINHPGLTTWPGLTRVTRRGLLYVGTNGHHGPTEYRRQHADHPAAVVTITPKEHR